VCECVSVCRVNTVDCVSVLITSYKLSVAKRVYFTTLSLLHFVLLLVCYEAVCEGD
jgi:hypothetical protein